VSLARDFRSVFSIVRVAAELAPQLCRQLAEQRVDFLAPQKVRHRRERFGIQNEVRIVRDRRRRKLQSGRLRNAPLNSRE